jgi:diguanylate cyclase (GGDEF)-like protein/PAS domain S-box-containing protein
MTGWRGPLLVFLALAAPRAHALDEVTLQLNWKHQFQFAGYYAALEKGFYRNAGLEVRIQEVDVGQNPADAVLRGDAEYGVGASELVHLRGQGRPVVALAVIIQHSPLIVLARKSAGIEQLHDLVGKRIMLMPHETELYAYFQREGLPIGLVRKFPHSFNPKDLIEGRVDALSGYATDEPYVLQRAGLAFVRFSPQASGIDFYGDTLFTSEQHLRKRPAQVKAFREATLAGWRYAMAHPGEIADLILAKYSERHTRDHLMFEAREMTRLMQPELVQIGHMNPGRWLHIAQTYVDLGMMASVPALDDFLYAPEPQTIPRWTYGMVLMVAILITLVAYFVSVNRRLAHAMRERQKAYDLMAQSEEKYRVLAENSADVIWQLDERMNYAYVNPADEKLRGFKREEVIGKPVSTVLTPASLEVVRRINRQQKADEAHGIRRDAVKFEVEEICKDGSTVWVEANSIPLRDKDGLITGYFGISRDTSARRRHEQALSDANAMLQHQLDEIHRLQAELQELAVRDGLTNLYNRRYLDETLDRELSRAKREGYPLSLVMIDIDHFKRLNDTYGHQAGDKVLRELAALLWGDVRAEDVPCRYGGEEFLVLLPRMPLDVAMERAEAWRKTFQATRVPFGDFQLSATLSCGLAAYPEHARTPDELIRCSDEALYKAKHRGRNRCEIFRPAHETNG